MLICGWRKPYVNSSFIFQPSRLQLGAFKPIPMMTARQSSLAESLRPPSCILSVESIIGPTVGNRELLVAPFDSITLILGTNLKHYKVY